MSNCLRNFLFSERQKRAHRRPRRISYRQAAYLDMTCIAIYRFFLLRKHQIILGSQAQGCVPVFRMISSGIRLIFLYSRSRMLGYCKRKGVQIHKTARRGLLISFPSQNYLLIKLPVCCILLVSTFKYIYSTGTGTTVPV
jgi:hypothetical protein